MENAPRLRTRIVAEAANGPTSSEASDHLFQRGVMVLPDAYTNAGGVTVSYFEWLKNLSHVRFGRMEKRFEERSNRQLLAAVEQATGRIFAPEEVRAIVHGADEIDLVNSGLEQTMIEAFHEIRLLKLQLGPKVDLRTASMVGAIRKVATAYKDRGIFP